MICTFSFSFLFYRAPNKVWGIGEKMSMWGSKPRPNTNKPLAQRLSEMPSGATLWQVVCTLCCFIQLLKCVSCPLYCPWNLLVQICIEPRTTSTISCIRMLHSFIVATSFENRHSKSIIWSSFYHPILTNLSAFSPFFWWKDKQLTFHG